MELESLESQGIPVYSFPGVSLKHGFVGAALNFRSSPLDASARRFVEAFGLRRLCLVRQVHSAHVPTVEPSMLAADTESVCVLGLADGIFIPVAGRLTGRGLAFGIRTADCLPILMRSGESIVLLHAGWRGLASGVIGQALRLLLQGSPGTTLEVLIGPAAGSGSYEVGWEVIEAVGDSSVFRRDDERSSYWLSLADTALRLLSAFPGEIRSSVSEICTISDPRFHSYRRQGDECGNNLSFVII